MADHTFASGEVLTASNMNTYGAHTGGALNSWTPTVTQSGTVANTPTATYGRIGRMIIAPWFVSVTGTGSANNVITVSLPVTAALSSVNTLLGRGKIFDASATLEYYGDWVLNSSTTAKLRLDLSGSAALYAGQTTANFAAALAASDVICGLFIFEAATG